MVPRPAIVEMNNKFIGGIDLSDILSSLYKFSVKSQRYRYMYIWLHIVTVAVINVWILYRKDQKEREPWIKPMALRRFQAFVGTLTSGRKLSMADHYPLQNRHQLQYNTSNTTDHFPIWETHQRCKQCNHFSHVYCQKCKVHLCLHKGRNCFYAIKIL